MPELPEVETVRQGLLPYCEGCTVQDVVVRQHKLRWPIPNNLPALLNAETISTIERRGKYLLFKLNSGTLLIHLGMSGTIQLVDSATPPNKHDHLDITLSTGSMLRYHDPRRFGAVLFTAEPAFTHPLLCKLGPEPLDPKFNSKELFKATRGKKTIVKSWLMNGKNVVGIGNIYVNEILFLSGVHPSKTVNQLTKEECDLIVRKTKLVLKKAIKTGGTTLKDFKNADGKPGYFKQQLMVYGQGESPCVRCNTLLTLVKIAGRQTVFCPTCQPLNNKLVN